MKGSVPVYVGVSVELETKQRSEVKDEAGT